MPVIFDWPDEPPPKKGRKRKKSGGDAEQESAVEVGASKEGMKTGGGSDAKMKGYATVGGRWSNDIVIYRGSVSEDTVAATIKGASPHKYAHGCDYAHSEVIYSLKVVATTPRLTLASASLDGSIRTWELYGFRDVRNGYVLKKPRKGAGDWTCASVIETPRRSGSCVTPSQIHVVEANTTMAVKCDDRVLICCRGRYSYGHEPVETSKQPPDERGRELRERFSVGDGPDWNCVASLRPSGMSCLSVLSATELAVGCRDGTIQMWTHDGSNNRFAWGCPMAESQDDNPNIDPERRCCNLTLEGHTGKVANITKMSLGFGDILVLLSTSHDKTVRIWRKIDDSGTGGDKLTFKSTALKGFNDMVSHLMVIPETQEFACYSGGRIYVVKVYQKENSAKLSTNIRTVRTGPITCATKLSSDALAVGFLNPMGAMGIAATKQNAQIWRRDEEDGEWSACEKDSISGLPNSVWGLSRELVASNCGSRMRLHLKGGGGNGPSFNSTWEETKDGGWEEMATVIIEKD
eukprot:CAMPEP_0178511636 /NCGR_PEP_ID=MMETSP0696-20121128/22471_1 /TAXON_ID=265572 /ORGANISM="Extubocellulus spinifer, Strain CCMP396" /LENGTH=519 /DNA_ID=CAMNT_0020141429 /DNA_START=295 /DNA_END=1854 /DNA_ORIENTATION=+